MSLISDWMIPLGLVILVSSHLTSWTQCPSGVQGGQQEQALPQLLTRLSGLVHNPPSSSVAQAAEKAATNMSLLAPLARFHQAIQQENQEQVPLPAWPVHHTQLAPVLHMLTMKLRFPLSASPASDCTRSENLAFRRHLNMSFPIVSFGQGFIS